jgi:PPK2 family polyphosphate:nucleotide phosphotransferase
MKHKDQNGKKRKQPEEPSSIKVRSPATAPEPLSNRLPIAPGYPRYRVKPGKIIKLKDLNPDESEHYRAKEEVEDELKRQRQRIENLQERLYAENKQSLLIVLQAMDTGGKDGTIEHVFEDLNPQGCRVESFKAPTEEELAHDFLWRAHKVVPRKRMIGIFNRSHYEDVLVVRVHKLAPDQVWKARYEQINAFEQILAANGTTIIKFFLYISKDEQKRRLESRLEDPTKYWKFASNDVKERAYWDDYMMAYQDAINKCSTEEAPWYVVPANKKWYRNLVVARTIADTLETMNPQYPPPEEGIEHTKIPD